MNREEILSHVDHTLLKPEATWPQIQQLCDEAIANHTASVCINTCYVKQAVAKLGNTEIRTLVSNMVYSS